MNNTSKRTALLVDDEEHILQTVSIALEQMGLEVYPLKDPNDALRLFQKRPFDIALIDLKMSPIDGLTLLSEIKKIEPLTTVIIITAHGTIDSAVEAIRKGAYDYLQKPFALKDLQYKVEKALEYTQLQQEVTSLRKQLASFTSTEIVESQNPKMQSILRLAKEIAESNITVLIEGESGTGKEVIAQLLHNYSSRKDKPFIRINCGAIPEHLLESELFGHVKGAFTGAIKDRPGKFESADGGSILFDEIAELPLQLQVKLLRFLQNFEFERVGENTVRKVDVRVITSTNRSLQDAMKEGTFREDLFYRLNVIRLQLPPLRERIEDLQDFVFFFLKRYSERHNVQCPTVTPETMKIFRRYRWPGNIRELEHAIERAVFLAKGNQILPAHLPEEIIEATSHEPQYITLEEMEKNYIAKLLREVVDYDKVADILQIDSSTLWRKRKKYNL